MTKPPSKKTRSMGASSNWYELVKKLKPLNPTPLHHSVKRQKLDSGESNDNHSSSLHTSTPLPSLPLEPPVSEHAGPSTGLLNTPVLGKYIALDCEMVGVGLCGSESSLARVSLVDYDGTVILDEYVQQRERVVDYRTPWSGIRESDMINAKPFEEVQKTVNDLLDGRILIGHAVHNDLKALFLSHPTRRTRDTQVYAYKFALSKTPKISLKKLARQELGIVIQNGEHSSVEDAKATMAVYRLHRGDWERVNGSVSLKQGPKRKQVVDTTDLFLEDLMMEEAKKMSQKQEREARRKRVAELLARLERVEAKEMSQKQGTKRKRVVDADLFPSLEAK